MENIGASVMPLTSEELHRMAAQSLHGVLAEQLVRGLN
jgi:hypothetical protein